MIRTENVAKVCNVLGFPEGQWQYPVNFNLDDSGEGVNYFSGDVNANRLSVARDVSFSPLSKVSFLYRDAKVAMPFPSVY